MSLDTRGREAATRAHAAVATVELPDATAVVVRRRRQRLVRATLAGVVAVLVVSVGAVPVERGTTGSSRPQRVQVQPTTSTSPPIGASLEFRAVEYADGDPFDLPASAAACKTGLPAFRDAVIRFDPAHRYCFGLGPVVATGDGLESASVFYDASASQWTVHLRWNGNDLVNNFVRPLVDKQMAIVVNDMVQTIAVIKPGIGGRDVNLTGHFTKDEAVNVVASLTGVSPSAVPVSTR